MFDFQLLFIFIFKYYITKIYNVYIYIYVYIGLNIINIQYFKRTFYLYTLIARYYQFTYMNLIMTIYMYAIFVNN